jgi:predicted MPP superfamily phosphohydrolase
MAAASVGVGASGLGGYALAEPWFCQVQHYNLTPPGWPAVRSLRIVALADIHACYPFMSEARIRSIVAMVNSLDPDVTVLLGDYVVSSTLIGYFWTYEEERIAEALAGLSARRGVFAILGNHDWWDDQEYHGTRDGLARMGSALSDQGIRVLENEAVLTTDGIQPVWIAGLGDQWAYWRPRDPGRWAKSGRPAHAGRDDLPGTLSRITSKDPAILLIHEPDAFVDVPSRISLTLAGHTHGGQVRVFGHAPTVPSIYGSRFRYGHIEEHGRHLIVSGGLGCSFLPIRLSCPPEIVVVDLGPPRKEVGVHFGA